MKVRRITWTLAVGVLIDLHASAALANGRFPRAERLVEGPSDADKLTLAGTYGLLLTEDRGQHWFHVCDAAFSFQTGFGSDPLLELNASGDLLMSVQQSMTMSRDRGCDWSKVYAPSGPGSIDDFAVFAGDRDDVIALETLIVANSIEVHLKESRDGGKTWTAVGTPLPSSMVHTIDVDPTNRNHLYASASPITADAGVSALLLTSFDRGTSWTVRPMTGITGGTPFIAAIHPKDGNKLFVRTDSWKPGANYDVAGDALYYSSDGGDHWTLLLHPGGDDVETPGAKLLAFALSPDGSSALAGYGDPYDPTRVVDPDRLWMGIYKSTSDGTYSFGAGAPDTPSSVVKTPVSCLTWTKTGIYACMNPPAEAQYLGFTNDPNVTPSSIAKIMRVEEVEGVPPSCSGRATTTCSWSTDCMVLGACGGRALDAGTDTPVIDASAIDAAEDAHDGSAGAPMGDQLVALQGCGCRAAPTRGRSIAGWLALASIAFTSARFRRARGARRQTR